MDRLTELQTFLRQYTSGGIALAFSGGVDSTLLLAVLADMCRANAFPLTALTMHSTFQPEGELADIKVLAEKYAVPLLIFRNDPLEIPEVRTNQQDRCYHCKRFIFSNFKNYTSANGFAVLLDGTHAGDLNVYRPGRKALAELGVISPLAELGMDKPAIRELAEDLGLPVKNKPAAPCLATRFEYGTLLTPELLKKTADGENALREYLPAAVPLRLRVQGDLARIEVQPEAMDAILRNREVITSKLQALGFRFVTLDLQGFRSGSYDGQLKQS